MHRGGLSTLSAALASFCSAFSLPSPRNGLEEEANPLTAHEVVGYGRDEFSACNRGLFETCLSPAMSRALGWWLRLSGHLNAWQRLIPEGKIRLLEETVGVLPDVCLLTASKIIDSSSLILPGK